MTRKLIIQIKSILLASCSFHGIHGMVHGSAPKAVSYIGLHSPPTRSFSAIVVSNRLSKHRVSSSVSSRLYPNGLNLQRSLSITSPNNAKGRTMQQGSQQRMNKYDEEDVDEGALFQPTFKRGDKVQVEVIKFGPLGASVDVIAHKSHDPADCIPQDEPALGRGVILQSEINYFRRGRAGVDVVRYEILPAYVENIREEKFRDEFDEEVVDVRLDVSLRPPGGRAKAMELGEQILEKLNEAGGSLDVGDKSSPQEIDRIFPGASKGAFKKAVAGLYKKGLVSPGPNSISLM
mmetsp:Transcript_17518/g.36765  ORF Transcript_17518/g.36765 Transcript_17518/m.36765 type:complete len:291 (+) Transcript_17518:152-1024(+)